VIFLDTQNYYSPTVFKSIGLTGTNTSLLTTGVFGVIKTVFALLWCFFIVDRYGRRGVLFVGSVGGAIAMYIIGSYLAVARPDLHPSTTLPSGGVAAMAFFYIWTICEIHLFDVPSIRGLLPEHGLRQEKRLTISVVCSLQHLLEWHALGCLR
jgi:MFS family permease